MQDVADKITMCNVADKMTMSCEKGRKKHSKDNHKLKLTLNAKWILEAIPYKFNEKTHTTYGFTDDARIVGGLYGFEMFQFVYDEAVWFPFMGPDEKWELEENKRNRWSSW